MGVFQHEIAPTRYNIQDLLMQKYSFGVLVGNVKCKIYEQKQRRSNKKQTYELKWYSIKHCQRTGLIFMT